MNKPMIVIVSFVLLAVLVVSFTGPGRSALRAVGLLAACQSSAGCE